MRVFILLFLLLLLLLLFFPTQERDSMAAITAITEVSASRERGFAVGSPGAGLQCQLRKDGVTFSRKQPPNKQDRSHSVQEVLNS